MFSVAGLSLEAQSFRIDEIRLSGTNVVIQHPGSTNSYFVLYRGTNPSAIRQPADAALGRLPSGQFSVPLGAQSAFFRVSRVPQDAPLDTDGDGIDDLYELARSAILNPLDGSDASRDPDGDGRTHLQEYAASLPLTGIRSTSPSNGEGGVAVTRETVFRFTRPLATATVLTTNHLYAQFGGRRILSRIELSTDRQTATLFYLEPLPASARIRVTLEGGGMADALGRPVDPDGDGAAGGAHIVDFDTLSLTLVAGTAVAGRVFASELATGGGTNQSVNVPLAGVTITVDGKEETMRTVTDAFGNFRLEPAPTGEFFVHVDGRTASSTNPTNAYYPFVGKKWRGIAGEEVNIGNVYLPLIIAGTLTPTVPNQEAVVTFPAQVLREHPELSGVSITVPPNSLFSDNGVRGGMIGIAPVPPDRLPEPLPPGLNFSLVITVQTDGPSNFDRPVPACFPNLPDPLTGEFKPPGATSALWSFNHDTGRWEIVGPMTVSADGRLVCTDPGVGILQPGWHGSADGSTASGGDEYSGGGPDSDYEPENGGPPDASDPVYLFSGEFHLAVVDLSIPGRGMDFMWNRKYRSKVGPRTAQGHGWDYSYNVSIEGVGADIALRNGNSRVDRYQRQLDGTYSRDGHFRDLVKNGDNTFTLMFEDTARWHFLPLGSGPTSGRLSRIEDRNGNTMRFTYDAAGRLTTITDTLDRHITVAYSTDGYIASVTDFAGRSVRYTYYDGIEAGGNRGDLKSVTKPAVVGTPNGNDFPDGKTTTYTYSTGFADDRLNHNLLTITDGRRSDSNDPTFGEGPYLVNQYSTTTDPKDPNYDRVLRQVLGGDILDYTYVRQLPSRANGNVVSKTIVNDRNGNVKEYFYDTHNRMARMREYTGRADPRTPTTEAANRPQNKLRASDPDFFETRYEWNDDSLQKRIVHPNGNITEYVYESDLNPNAPPRTRANLRTLRQLPGTHTPAGDQSVIEEHYEYDPRFGGAGYMTRLTDGRGNATSYTYDSRGNRIRTQHRVGSIVEESEYNAFGQMTARVWPDNGTGHRRRDEHAYYTSGPQRGYLQSEIIDATHLRLTTSYEYDLVGNIIRVIDPNGNDTRFVVNAHNQVVREISREVRPGSGIRYERDQFYDANNNLVRVDIQNVDDRGVLQANTHITIRYDYEILNCPIRVTEEVDATRSVVEEYAYDGNRNRVLTRYGEAVNGNQPANVRRTVYDERDLEYQVIRAPGDPAQSTTQFDYDANGNQTIVREGIEDSPRILITTFDGYNRPVTVADPLGNLLHSSYDPNDNRVRTRFEGELLDGLGSAGNVRLNEVGFTFDAMNRLVRTESAFFDPATQAPIGTGTAIGQVFYNDDSDIVRMIDANGHEQRRVYDTANRLTQTVDAKGNSVTFAFDANDNIVTATESEIPDLGGPAEIFVTRFEYDGLDRQTRMIDSAGNIEDSAHDSRDNQTLSVDAQRVSAGQPGNTTRFEYDGLNRLLRSVTTMTTDGTGSGASVGSVVLHQAWDESNRLRSQTDPNGNTTTYSYDALNRETQITFADGTARSSVFDVHNNRVRTTDASGSVSRKTFDLLNRLTRVDVTAGPGVATTTTFEDYRYDGLSRLVRGEDDDSVVTLSYNSFSHVIRETQNGKTILSTYDPIGNLLRVVYPGGRTITNAYDELDRKKVVQDQAGLIARYDYVGPGRVKRREYGNSTVTEYEHDGRFGVANSPNDFGVRQIVRTTHSQIPSGTVFANHTYAWDRMFNKSSRRDQATGGRIRQFNYDSLYRLVRSTTSEGGPPLQTVQYDLDPAGNRRTVSGGPDAGAYAQATGGTEDAQVNQYTSTPFGVRRYDAQGNLTRIGEGLPGQRDIAYDYRRQMVEHSEQGTGIRTRYAYDFFGRRIQKSVERNGQTAIVNYYYLGWQTCEEQDAAGATVATYVHGNYLDEVLTMERAGADFFYHTDDQFSVIGVTDAAGTLLERYEYEDYGAVQISDASGVPRARSAIDNPYLFTGRRFDPETGFYYFRTRYLDVRTGRFTTRDTIGIWGDPVELGNGFTFVGNNPQSMLDPMGLGVLQWLLGNNYDDPDSEILSAAAEGLQGGGSILVNTMSFGGSDKIGLTNSEQYQGPAYDASRFCATVSREALLAALSGGASAARGGACMLQGMGRLAPLIKAIQASKHGPKIANLIHRILEAINTGQDAADFVRELWKLTEGNGSLFDAIISGIGVVSGIDNLRSRPGFCFAEGTGVSTDEGFIPIEQIRVGDRVETTDNPEFLNQTKITPARWKEIHLVMPLAGGGDLEIRLLRPLHWLEEVGCRVGGVVELSLEGKGIHGVATVLQVLDCPAIRPGGGRVVLATIRSGSDSVLRIYIAGSDQPLRATAAHPLFSETVNDWKPAAAFQAGERLRTRDGSVEIARIEVEPGVQAVFNLEVETSHEFYVSEFGILSHNTKPCVWQIKDKFPPGSKESRQLRRFVKAWNEELANAGGSMTRRTLTAAEERASAAWKKAMRKAHPERFKNKVVGHTPDAAAGGPAAGGKAMALDPRVNASVGGQVSAKPPGYTYNQVEVVR